MLDKRTLISSTGHDVFGIFNGSEFRRFDDLSSLWEENRCGGVLDAVETGDTLDDKEWERVTRTSGFTARYWGFERFVDELFDFAGLGEELLETLDSYGLVILSEVLEALERLGFVLTRDCSRQVDG